MKRYKLLHNALLFTLALSLAACSFNKKAIRMSEDNRRVGEAYMGKGDFSEALKYFLLAQEFYDKDYLLHDDLGKVYVAKKKYDLAIGHFKKSLELDPEYAPGKNNLGSAYLLAEQWDNAIEVFTELNENLVYATPHYPLYNLGWAYHNKKDYKTAIKYYNKCLKVQHGFVQAYRGIGLAYKEMGQMNLALEYFEKAAEKSPRFPQLYLDLGEAYAFFKKYDEAMDAFAEISRIQPDSEISDQAKSRLVDMQKKVKEQ